MERLREPSRSRRALEEHRVAMREIVTRANAASPTAMCKKTQGKCGCGNSASGRNYTTRAAAIFTNSLFLHRSHVDDEAVLHVGLQHALVGFVDLLHGDDFNVAGDVVLAAEVEHLLRLRDAADE